MSGPTFTAGALATDANSINWVGDRVFFYNWVWTPGSEPQQLTQRGDITASPDGRTIVFVRDTVSGRQKRWHASDTARHW